jgi:hypothetical protein
MQALACLCYRPAALRCVESQWLTSRYNVRFSVLISAGDTHLPRISLRGRVGTREKSVARRLGPEPANSHRKMAPAQVRFGSKADMTACNLNVRFTPESGHRLSLPGCPLCANSGSRS